MKEPSWWTLSPAGEKVYRLGVRANNSGDIRRIGLFTDLHWDNAHCRLDALKRSLDDAAENDWPCLFFGDFFCVMQGRWDPRASQEGLRDEHRGGNYLDRVIDTSVQWFEPFKHIMAFVSPGNHEVSIRRRHETDLISRFVGGMRSAGARTIQGGYWGYILLALIGGRQVQRDWRSLHYHHGYGGGGPITRGFIDHSRTRSADQADIYISGHIHRRNMDENIVRSITCRGNIEMRQQLFLRSSCWKDESKDEWHSGLMGRDPRPIGGWWLDLYVDKRGKNDNYQFSKIVPVMI